MVRSRFAILAQGESVTINTIIVDDERPAREELIYLLKSFPEVNVVALGKNGLEAVSLIKEHDPDLVFLDYMMPVMDGAEVLRAMVSDPSIDGVPVVLMSSMPEAMVAERCSDYTAFMRKPFKIAQVTTLARRLLIQSDST